MTARYLVVPRDEALRRARAAVDAARRARDSMPVRAAAEAAAMHSRWTADEIEQAIRTLRQQAGLDSRRAGQRIRLQAPAAA